MSPVMEHMTFDDLSALYRVEMNGSSISQVRRDLFKAMADLLTRLRGEYEKQLALDPDSVMCEGAEHRRKSAERLCKDIVRIRATKICNMAFLGALGSKNHTDMLTEEEKAYYYKVLEASKAHLSEVDRLRGKRVTVATHIDEIPARDIPAPEPPAEEGRQEEPAPGPAEDAAEPPEYEPFPEEGFPDIDETHGEPPVRQDAPTEAPKTAVPPEAEDEPFPDDVPMDDFDDIPDPMDTFGPDLPPEEWDEPEAPIAQAEMPREDEDESLKPVLIRVLEDLPEFAGPSRDYSLLKEDVVTIPKAMADILVNTGKASLIDPSP
ncbi:MAG: hypothetical protein IKQ60_07945 [Candidatus Methanomethylophilaceae archaeon]|nr:hypothetical protein [Candidatus Methanomethylophilaceae archaeon]